MDSVESAQAWREARQNVAARKPVPNVVGVLNTAPVVVREVVADSRDMADFFPRDLPPYEGLSRTNNGRSSDGEGNIDSVEDHQAARTRREISEANMAEMREAEERGDLIRVSAVRTTLAAIFSSTRDALLQIPARLAPLIAADSDPASVQSTLHAEIHQSLHDLAGASDRVGRVEGVVQ